jgi:hypothetical protein
MPGTLEKNADLFYFPRLKDMYNLQSLDYDKEAQTTSQNFLAP